MGADSSKEQSRSNSPEHGQRRKQYTRQQMRQEPAQTYHSYQAQTTYQSPVQSPTFSPETPATQRHLRQKPRPERPATYFKPSLPYTSEHSQNANNLPNSFEKSRQPYNYNSEDLHGIKQSTNLYPNLNVSRAEDSFVYVNDYGQQRSPPPSAPPASVVYEPPVSHDLIDLRPKVNTATFPPDSPDSRPPAAPASQVTALPKAAPRPSPSSSSSSSPKEPETSQMAKSSANENRSKSGANARGRQNKDEYSCPTCGQRFGITIFQCTSGHGSCKECREAGKLCGVVVCRSPITEIRNIMLETIIADLRTQCQNQGCTLSFKYDEMQRHLKECPFGVMDCPMGTIFGQCSTRCKVADMAAHFDDCHKEQRTAEIDKEMFVFNICMETQKLFLIKNGPYNFLIHVKVDETKRKISMTVQLLGTKISAEKWTYEFHVYNKRQPLRKYLYSDSCKSISTPVEDIFKENQCATLPLSYAMTFVNESALTYKFYVKLGKENSQPGRRKGPRNNAKERSS